MLKSINPVLNTLREKGGKPKDGATQLCLYRCFVVLRNDHVTEDGKPDSSKAGGDSESLKDKKCQNGTRRAHSYKLDVWTR